MVYKLLVCSFCHSKCPDGQHRVDVYSVGTIFEQVEATICPYCREDRRVGPERCEAKALQMADGVWTVDLTSCLQCSNNQ